MPIRGAGFERDIQGDLLRGCNLLRVSMGKCAVEEVRPGGDCQLWFRVVCSIGLAFDSHFDSSAIGCRMHLIQPRRECNLNRKKSANLI